jgi:hypothetical protein
MQMYEESQGGPSASIAGHGHNPSLTSDYGLRPHYPRHSSHQRLGAYSPSLPSSALPAMLAPEGIGQSRSASPHMSQFNFLPQSQTEMYPGSYPESEVDILESAAPPNVSRFNSSSFPSIHNLPRSSHRAVCIRYYVLLHPTLTHTLEHTISRVLSRVLPPFRQVVSCITIAAPATRGIRGAEKGKLRSDNQSRNVEVSCLFSPK